MKLHDKIQIPFTPGEIWRFIEDPQQMKRWNSKLVSVQSISQGKRGKGYFYRAKYKMRKECEFAAEVVEYVENQKWTVHFSNGIGDGFSKDCNIFESYELIPNRNGTLVKQLIDIRNSGIPIIFQLLIWIITTIGSKANEGPLDSLKKLVQNESAPTVV
jgi:hypothetical protein